MRTYERTHPWITFRVDLRRAPVSLWLLLGEARSKCKHVAGVPLQRSIANRLYQMYLAKGVHATTAIEGNTLSEEQVAEHLEGRLEVPESREYLKQEIDNLIQAFDKIVADIRRAGPSDQISPALIRRFNEAVLKDLPLPEGAIPGVVRQYSVGVGRYRGAPAEDCDLLLENLCRWLNDESFDADGSLGIAAALLKAILAHLYIAWIHPFGDGNGRTARLVEFYILVNAGVPDPSAHLLSNHYNQTRLEYYRQLDHASRSKGDVVPFLEYAVRGFVDELRDQIQGIRDQQWTLAWKDLVAEFFQADGSPTAERRKLVLLELSRSPEVVTRGEIPLLSAKVAQLYARKTDRTLSRDLGFLVDNGLVERSAAGYRARREIILAFLPPSWPKRPGGAEGELSGPK